MQKYKNKSNSMDAVNKVIKLMSKTIELLEIKNANKLMLFKLVRMKFLFICVCEDKHSKIASCSLLKNY